MATGLRDGRTLCCVGEHDDRCIFRHDFGCQLKRIAICQRAIDQGQAEWFAVSARTGDFFECGSCGITGGGLHPPGLHIRADQLTATPVVVHHQNGLLHEGLCWRRSPPGRFIRSCVLQPEAERKLKCATDPRHAADADGAAHDADQAAADRQAEAGAAKLPCG